MWLALGPRGWGGGMAEAASAGQGVRWRGGGGDYSTVDHVVSERSAWSCGLGRSLLRAVGLGLH
jgi:hypothetical protein